MQARSSFGLQPESERLLHLDALRLIASAAIVLFHLSEKFNAPSQGVVLPTIEPLSLFVDMFFVISGYVIAFIYFGRITRAQEFGRFMQKRLARLVPLHWATLTFFVLLGLASTALHIHANHESVFDLRCLPANFLLLHATGLCPHPSFNTASWSISAEMFMYAISPAIFWGLRRSPAALFCAIVLVWAALTAVSYKGTPWPFWSTVGVLRALPSFMFGAWLFGIKKHLPEFAFSASAMWGCLIAFITGCYFGSSIFLLVLILYGAVVFAVMADNNGRGASKGVRLLAAGGQLTYSSYMLHQPIIVLLLTIGAEHVLHLHGTWKNIALVLTFLTVWPVSYISLIAFEYPTRRWITDIGAKSSCKVNEAPKTEIGG